MGTLLLTQEDLAMWKTDPHEFVRRSLGESRAPQLAQLAGPVWSDELADVMEEFSDPRVAAISLLIDLVRLRTRDFLPAVMQLASAHLKT